MSEVLDSELLHRRVHPIQCKDNGVVSSAAFRDPRLSVDRAGMRSVDESLSGHPTYGLVSIETRIARGHKLEVIYQPELFNRAHTLILGKKTRAISKDLAKNSKWVRHVPVDLLDF